MKNRIIVIIPSYNEERSIGPVVKGVLKNKKIHQCVVVDDCSIDNTVFVARGAGAHVISKQQNTGTGEAIKTGLVYAVKNGADMVVLMDADGQHDPKHITHLLRGLAHGADYVIGSRYIKRTKNSTSSLRRLGTKIISLLISAAYKKRIFDATSGFRAMRRLVLLRLSSDYPTVFSEPETIVGLLKYGYAVKEVSVEMKPRLYGRSSISMVAAIRLMVYISRNIVCDMIFR